MTPPEEVGRWENFPFFHVSAVASHLAQAQDALSGAFAGAFVPEFTKVAKFGKVWSVALICALLRWLAHLHAWDKRRAQRKTTRMSPATLNDNTFGDDILLLVRFGAQSAGTFPCG